MQTLSILIPTIPRDDESIKVVLDQIGQHEGMNVITLRDNKEHTLGWKRQVLLETATSDYVVFVDSDDHVTPEYVPLIMQAIQQQPDVVGFKGWMTTDGRKHMDFSISKDHPYKRIGGTYFRYSNHLAPVKRTIALQIGFNNMGYQEDYDYARRLHESGLCKTEVFIDAKIYHYLFISCK